MNTACPSCSCTESLEALAAEIKRLKDVKRQRARKAAEVGRSIKFINGSKTTIAIGNSSQGRGGSIDIGVGQAGTRIGDIAAGDGSAHTSSDHLNIDTETLLKGRLTCVECGTWYDPKSKERAEEKRAEIDALTNEIYSAVERLGQLGGGE